MPDRTDQECDERCPAPPNMRPRGTVYMASSEVVYGYVPLAREFEPVGAVPPVGVKVTVCEAGYFGGGAENVLKDY